MKNQVFIQKYSLLVSGGDDGNFWTDDISDVKKSK